MFDVTVFAKPEAWLSLATLTLLEVVLGVDNVIFISIVASKLPAAQQPRARKLGLMAALVTRVGLLFALSWVLGLEAELFRVLGQSISGRDLILFAGGLFLVGKSAHEIFDKLEVEHPEEERKEVRGSGLALVLVQIMILDLVFSLDSVITAVGMARDLPVMIAAMLIATAVMVIFAGRISRFIERHPSMKVLALSFLLLIGVMLVADAFGQHISKGYIYFAICFALLVEVINIRMRKAQQKPVHLHHKHEGVLPPAPVQPQS
jgi:predicted tellurium resistance membrane protein TerC